MTNTEPVAVALESCADALRTLALALRGQRPVEPAVPPTPAPERLLRVDEAAAILGVTRGWLYRSAPRLPFARHLSPRVLRFSEAGIRRWIERRP